jgi:tRNA A-37 threonylcarbamoyl transferase component Bud32/tetratricopeptide (TPR) repeat protein
MPVEDLQPRLSAALSGRYTIEREIGRGGMSIVYLARDLRNERRVALKVLRPDLAQALGSDRFLREIKVAAGLTHPHVLPLFDSDIADGLLFYTMPYVEGESLRHRLQREGRLPVADAVRIARDVADALAYAHSQNIVHRDIKPENILIEAGHPVVSDFGIARAISAANEARMTGSGIVVGTVEYMSPEQASGDEVDGRSDVYSLGCVLYEMLSGRAPYARQTPSGRVPVLSDERRDVPIDVEYAIEVALARVPAERFATASDFAAALGPAEITHPSGRWLRNLSVWWRVTAAVSVLALATLGVILRPHIAAAKLDSSLYVVVPFGHRAGAAPKLINGDRCESLLLSSFGRWEDVRLVDDLRVHDARARLGLDSLSLNGALNLAREVGSGQLVWGDVAQFGDTIEVRAALYDVRRGTARRRHMVKFSSEAADVADRFKELADTLLLGHVRSEDAVGAVMGTRLLSAWQAYADGQAALAQWDLQGAERAFSSAIEFDPNYPHAHLWLAQTLAWAGRPVSEWRSHALTSVSAASRLGFRERGLSQALAALATQQFFQACGMYRGLLARDSLDFAAWFGLGDCQTKDRLALRDSTSPSGWRFRSSFGAAADAFQRALELIPSVHRAFSGVAFDRLSQLFFAEPGMFRRGYALTPDTLWLGAWPGLVHDTLVFIPFPLADIFAGRKGTIPPTAGAALNRNREILRQITARWVQAFPNSADAHEALGRVLETLGEPAALASVSRARELSSDTIQRLRLLVTEVRLFVKSEDFDGARLRADSALQARGTAGAEGARDRAGLAALTGHVNLAADLLAQGAPLDTPMTTRGVPIIVARPAAEQALRLQVYAAFGAPKDSLVAGRARSQQLINTWVEQRRQAQAREALLYLPSILAFPEVGLSPLHVRSASGGLLSMQWDFAHQDTAALRATLEQVDSLRTDLRPGDMAVFVVYHESWLLLALGDTTRALARIDPFLEALPTIGLHVVGEPAESALLVRLMVLRAEIAAQRNDRPTAERWAKAVAALWADADPVLRPTVQRMRQLF